MAVQNIPRPEDKAASQTLIGEAAAPRGRALARFPADFFAALYGRAAPEDLERYRPEELAAIAEQAWTFLSERSPAPPRSRVRAARRSRDVAVLEILNDDMPFLVDSVIGELSERGAGRPPAGPSGLRRGAR